MESRPRDDGGRFPVFLPCTWGKRVWIDHRDAATEETHRCRFSTHSRDENAEKQEAATVSGVTVRKICSFRRQIESMVDAPLLCDFQHDATALTMGEESLSSHLLTHITTDVKQSLSHPVRTGSRRHRLITKQSDFMTHSGNSSSYECMLLSTFFFFFRNPAQRNPQTGHFFPRRVINSGPVCCQRSTRPL